MAEQYGLTLLAAKYSELAGQLKALDKEAKAIKAAMTHLEASIRLDQHEYEAAYTKLVKNPYQYNPYIKHGAYARVAMDVLRDAASLCQRGRYTQVAATGTSLVVLLLPIGIGGVYVFCVAGKIDMTNIKQGLLISVGMFLGSFIGAKVALVMPDYILKQTFCVFLFFVAARMWMMRCRSKRKGMRRRDI